MQLWLSCIVTIFPLLYPLASSKLVNQQQNQDDLKLMLEILLSLDPMMLVKYVLLLLDVVHADHDFDVL